MDVNAYRFIEPGDRPLDALGNAGPKWSTTPEVMAAAAIAPVTSSEDGRRIHAVEVYLKPAHKLACRDKVEVDGRRYVVTKVGDYKMGCFHGGMVATAEAATG